MLKYHPLRGLNSAAPIFWLHMRGLSWASSPGQIARTTRIGLAAGCAVSLIAAVLLYLSNIASSFLIGSEDALAPLIVVWAFIFLVNVLLTLFMDVRAALFGYENYHMRLGDPAVELILLTHVERSDLVRAWHASAQVRTWRLFSWIMGVRVTLCIVGFGVALSALDSALLFALVVSYWVCGAILLLVEPIIRLRAFTALGMAVQAHAGGTMGIFAVVGALLAVWLVALAALPLGVIPPVLGLLPFAVHVGWWALVRQFALRRVARHMAAHTS